jgi:hypothetical protein
MTYSWTSMQRHFPTLLITLPRILVSRLHHNMTRRTVIAGAIVAMTFTLIEERRRRFESVAAEHQSKRWRGIGESFAGPPTYYDGNGKIMTPAEVKASDWHAKLEQKYRSAAAEPWLPVEPDPPPPRAH